MVSTEYLSAEGKRAKLGGQYLCDIVKCSIIKKYDDMTSEKINLFAIEIPLEDLNNSSSSDSNDTGSTESNPSDEGDGEGDDGDGGHGGGLTTTVFPDLVRLMKENGKESFKLYAIRKQNGKIKYKVRFR